MRDWRRLHPDERREAIRAEFAEIQRRLSELARGAFLSKPHARDVVQTLPPLDVAFRLDFREHAHVPGNDEEIAKLCDLLEVHIDDAVLSLSAFRPGRVYCHFCQGATCAHSRPNDPKQIFRGYTQTGVPIWGTLLDLAIERSDDRIDSLAAGRGSAVLMWSERDELFRDLLPSFKESERHYDIRGQLALGYYHFGENGTSRKFAVTLQLIRSATRSRAVRLGMNAIGLLPDDADAETLLLDPHSYPFVDLFHATQRRLSEINQRLRAVPPARRFAESTKEAERLLHDLTLGVERHQRRTVWRTEHAQKRAGERTRPTGMARQDLMTARFDRVMQDAKDRTMVVLGGKGRVHVFTDDGKHVTSLHLDRKEIDARRHQNRWVILEREAVKVFLARARDVFLAAANATRSDVADHLPASNDAARVE